ncbi:helix-turn-helix domain-containing protein [Isoptericola rhizosphaerae]|uniref:helix-turn-helix domain-containing protein n=1 Tax=Isoptericola rhizosphaerae TaxID=3377837 RepID=UPI00383B7916
MTTSERRWPSLLTVAQAAEMLGRNPQTVLDLLHKGVLRGRKTSGGSYVLLRDQVLIDADRHRQNIAAAYRERRRKRS